MVSNVVMTISAFIFMNASALKNITEERRDEAENSYQNGLCLMDVVLPVSGLGLLGT